MSRHTLGIIIWQVIRFNSLTCQSSYSVDNNGLPNCYQILEVENLIDAVYNNKLLCQSFIEGVDYSHQINILQRVAGIPLVA